jgi:hypothetical protein
MDQTFLLVLTCATILATMCCLLRALYMFSEYESTIATVKNHDYESYEIITDSMKWRSVDSDYTRRTTFTLEYRDSQNKSHTIDHIMQTRLGRNPPSEYKVWYHRNNPEIITHVTPWDWFIYSSVSSIFIIVYLLKS